VRAQGDTGARKTATLPLGGLVLQVFVADALDEQGVSELATLDDLRGRLSRDDGVVLRAGDALVLA
jgi:hypothetical protein